MPWRFTPGPNKMSGPSAMERVVGLLCYMTGGIAGIIYIVLSRSSYQSDFFRFHFLQSIVLAIMAMLIGWAGGAFNGIMGPALSWFTNLLVSAGFGGAETIAGALGGILLLILQAFNLLPVYGAVMAALGKYAQIPFLSDVVRQQMR